MLTDNENSTLLRNKNSLAAGKNVGAATKPRAVLGDIRNNRSVTVNVTSKSDANDVQFKKPSVKLLKKDVSEW